MTTKKVKKTTTKRVSKISPKKKTQGKKIVMNALAVGATGILGYFGWRYFTRRKNNNHKEVEALIQNMDQSIVTQMVIPKPKPKTKYKPASYTPTLSEETFPLKRGSKNEHVRKLQEALIAKHGAQLLPKYGADGDFGLELVNALKKLGLPTTINQSTFNVITQGTIADPSTTGKDLYKAVVIKDYSKAIGYLKKLKSVEDYTTANEVFKQNRINGVRQTIVNGLLTVFLSTSQKQAIKFEFLRMGLQFDGSKWSLSGFDGLSIVTTVPTSVWVNATSRLKVPARMVLGNEISKRLDYTLFENSGKHFLVQTKSVKYL